jgi:hypothetical protein
MDLPRQPTSFGGFDGGIPYAVEAVVALEREGRRLAS